MKLFNEKFLKFLCFQADVLLVSSSSPNGLAYIETAELDGLVNNSFIMILYNVHPGVMYSHVFRCKTMYCGVHCAI